MITQLTFQHRRSVLDLAQTAIGFEEAELNELDRTLTGYLENPETYPGTWLLFLREDQVVGAAYYTSEAMTARTWNLLFLATHPAHQGQGIGTRLVETVLQTLSTDDQRLLLVETLDTEEFRTAQKFYLARGFTQVATIPDYYYPGGGKIVFTQNLSARKEK